MIYTCPLDRIVCHGDLYVFIRQTLDVKLSHLKILYPMSFSVMARRYLHMMAILLNIYSIGAVYMHTPKTNTHTSRARSRPNIWEVRTCEHEEFIRVKGSGNSVTENNSKM